MYVTAAADSAGQDYAAFLNSNTATYIDGSPYNPTHVSFFDRNFVYASADRCLT